MVADLTVTLGTKHWTIPATTVRRWIAFEDGAEGAVRPVVLPERIGPALAKIAKKVKAAPVSAPFLVANTGEIVGVKAGRDGRRLATAATVAAIEAELAHRRNGDAPAPVKAVTAVVEPKLTTAEAEKIAPRMTRLGAWTTRFELSERNYWGANIWLPARYANGTLLQPGQRFEWFSAVGPVVPSRGFGSGGVIKGDHSEPTGAMGGGMCSSSTTLFNAALRAGLEMGARANHTYYIDRYPLGLDATVWKAGGGVQTMSFRNDMKTPVLVRGWGTRSGGIGWVHYEIWGVRDGRTVSISRPTVRNVIPATTYEKPTTTLAPRVRKQTEWAMRGMDVWVTRVVRAKDGHVIHRTTYYSHYKKWDGIILVGVR
jgi:vancomycin resistance protein YoaR